MTLFVAQFSYDGSEREEFASVHNTLIGAIKKALNAVNQSKSELMCDLSVDDPDYEYNKLIVQGPETLDDGSTVVQLVNGVGNEVEYWHITETEVGE